MFHTPAGKELLKNIEKIITEFNYTPDSSFFCGNRQMPITHLGDNSSEKNIFLICNDSFEYGYYNISFQELLRDSNFMNALTLYFLTNIEDTQKTWDIIFIDIIGKEKSPRRDNFLEIKNILSNFFSKKRDNKTYLDIFHYFL